MWRRRLISVLFLCISEQRQIKTNKKKSIGPVSCFTLRNNRELGPIILLEKWHQSRKKLKIKIVWYNNWVNASKCYSGKRWWKLITLPFSDPGASSFERSLIYFPAAVWILHVNETGFLILFFPPAIALMQPWVLHKSTALMTPTANVICFGPWSGSPYIQLRN